MPKNNPVGIYLFKLNNRNTRAKCEICSKLTIKTPERRHVLHVSARQICILYKSGWVDECWLSIIVRRQLLYGDKSNGRVPQPDLILSKNYKKLFFFALKVARACFVNYKDLAHYQQILCWYQHFAEVLCLN